MKYKDSSERLNPSIAQPDVRALCGGFDGAYGCPCGCRHAADDLAFGAHICCGVCAIGSHRARRGAHFVCGVDSLGSNHGRSPEQFGGKAFGRSVLHVVLPRTE